MKNLSKLQIELLSTAMNYSDRESQLGDNMSNITGHEAREIISTHTLKQVGAKSLYNQLEQGSNEILEGLFVNEDLDERMQIEFDHDNHLKLSSIGTGWNSRVKPTTANREKTYGHQILWITEEGVNAYFDHIESLETPETPTEIETPKSDINTELEQIANDIALLEDKRNKLLRKQELLKELDELNTHLG